jgi:hypothetical protein
MPGGSIVRVNVAVLVTPPPVPWMVMVWVPTGAVVPTEKVTAWLRSPSSQLQLEGLAVTPVGRPVPVKFTMVAGPAVCHARTVVATEPPGAAVPDNGSTETAKSNAGLTGGSMVRVNVAVLVTPPPAPWMVMVWIPTGAVVPTEKVTVRLPLPSSPLQLEGLAVTPVGRPMTVKLTEVAGPAVRHARTVVVVLPPCVTVLDEGSAETAKSNAGAGASMVRVNVAVLVTPPPVPWMVMVWVPTGALVPTEMVTAWLRSPSSQLQLEGLAVTPVGRPTMPKLTLAVGPAVCHARTVVVVLPPCVTVLDEGSAEMEKSNAAAGAVTVRVNVAVLVTPPPVPWMVMV